MKTSPTRLPGVLVVEPEVYGDPRGWFMENWNAGRGRELGLPDRFEQANTSRSGHAVLRGLHYQWPAPQGKLVWVTEGRVLDVAVDIRAGSPTFGRWVAIELGVDNHRQLWIPEGFAHGFQVLSEAATVSYLCTRRYRAEHDAAVAYDDPEIGIPWPLPPGGLSDKDAHAPRLCAIQASRLPVYERSGPGDA